MMVKVQCIKCGREGSLTRKQTKSKGITYVYWYIEHHIGDKIKWCYLGKFDKLTDGYKTIIQKDTQNIYKSETPKSSFHHQTKHRIISRGSLAWLWRQTHDLESKSPRDRCPEVAGSTPAPGTF